MKLSFEVRSHFTFTRDQRNSNMGYIKVGLNILPRFKWAIEPTTVGFPQYST